MDGANKARSASNGSTLSDKDTFHFKIQDVNFDFAPPANFGPRINGLIDSRAARPLDHLLLFMPGEFVETLLEKANLEGRSKYKEIYTDITYGEFLKFYGICLYMEVVRFPERIDYWKTVSEGPFIAINMGRYMSRERYQLICSKLTCFIDQDTTTEGDMSKYWDSCDAIVTALNLKFKEVVTAGSSITIDESMIKSYHRDLAGQVKIRRKPRPVGNEILDLCDNKSRIVLHIEFNQGKELNSTKELVKEFGATTAAALRLTKQFWGTGRRAFMDSWFASVQTCNELLKKGIYSVGVVKTAHRNYPRTLLNDKSNSKGEWTSAVATAPEAPRIWCCKYTDKNFNLWRHAQLAWLGLPTLIATKIK